MNTVSKTISEATIRSSRQNVDRSLRAIEQMGAENSVVPETAAGRFDRVLAIYTAIKPLLALLGILPIIPSAWRSAIATFDQALEELAFLAPEVHDAFKAGKDL